MIFLPGGFELATMMRFNSGRPFSPTTGVDSNRDGIANDRPMLDGQVVRRNHEFRNVGFSDVSFRAQKNVVLPGEKTLSFAVDLFNVFDFDNVETTQRVWGDDLSVPTTNANFGKVKDANGTYILGSTLRTTPFQVQLGVRLQF
jgi:hypothetical protein